jgi:hypothetical protein
MPLFSLASRTALRECGTCDCYYEVEPPLIDDLLYLVSLHIVAYHLSAVAGLCWTEIIVVTFLSSSVRYNLQTSDVYMD